MATTSGQARQLWFLGDGKVKVRTCPVPTPGPGEVLVKVAMSALCGSELAAVRKETASVNGGHEAVGTVMATGPGCDRLKPGDRVGVSAVQGCGSCEHCRQGCFTYCASRIVVTGMHADYVVCRELGCHKLPDDIPWDAAVLISGDGLGVPHHVSRRLGDSAGQSVVVLGVGPIGLGNVLVQAHAGATVAAVDTSRFRLDLAQKYGATTVIEPKSVAAGADHDLAADVVGVVCRQPDVVLECAGRESTLRAALAVVRPGGTVVCVGEQGAVSLSPSADLIRRDITLMGSWFYHFSEFDEMVRSYRSGLAVESLITHRFALDRAAEAYQLFMSGMSGKVLLTTASDAED